MKSVAVLNFMWESLELTNVKFIKLSNCQMHEALKGKPNLQQIPQDLKVSGPRTDTCHFAQRREARRAVSGKATG